MPRRGWRAKLNDRESEIVGECLFAAANGPFFPAGECSTLFGLDRDELRAVAVGWANGDDEEAVFLAVSRAMNNLALYPHKQDEAWAQLISASPDEVNELHWKIRELAGANDLTGTHLAAKVAEFAARTDEDLLGYAYLAEVVRLADRLGVPVPDRLRRRS